MIIEQWITIDIGKLHLKYSFQMHYHYHNIGNLMKYFHKDYQIYHNLRDQRNI